MKNLLYHRVHPRNVKKVIESNSIKSHHDIVGNQICMTRNVIYMSGSRPFVVVFDRDKLRQKYKIEPFCLLGFKFMNKSSDFDRWKQRFEYGFENEERVYASEISLDIAEYAGILNVGHFDYRNPNKLFSNRLFNKHFKNM